MLLTSGTRLGPYGIVAPGLSPRLVVASLLILGGIALAVLGHRR